ncbi:DUF3861 family protein [Coralloluteibacterium stylophorae]|uniref:DUF3861 family protein n=1 Tax=Coralloluteibacterium stylophorae TaxID=1776034 RepID=A0A8J7VRW6_9GAMM|nr:DUF3861 family protein [Coralloluteibacterium stylophorae]MBS7456704.1 DUF3861 family protein [Coralloluteibacterium stylophorae]
MPRHRYRITITPTTRHVAAVEFDHVDDEDWVRTLEAAQRLPGLCADSRTGVCVGLRLLERAAAECGDDTFAELRPALDALRARLKPSCG